jgi:hypothetical protein
MRMIVEQLVEWRLAGEPKVLGENLPQRHFVHHKSHMTRPGLEPRATAVGSQRLTAWAIARPIRWLLNRELERAWKETIMTGRIFSFIIYQFQIPFKQNV